jgi:aryl-alcohol dehydrogenase-like predicted oxidoreductase
MEYRDFGTTGLKVSALGYGAGMIGDETISEIDVETILNSVLDNGITLIDTARGYGISEKRIGRHLSHRRDEFVLTTKVGYGIEGYTDWTYDCIIAGVEEALQRLKTDYIDIVHLHSCLIETLQKGEVINALEEVVSQGKIRVAAYSGENEAFDFAVYSNRFGSGMASLNICDQKIIDRILHIAKKKGMGFIAKRPIANAPWRFTEQPVGNYAEEYWHRWKAMKLKLGMDELEVAIRFSAFTYGVDSCIVGTTNIEHIKKNAELINNGKLPEEIETQIKNSFRQNDRNWIGQL